MLTRRTLLASTVAAPFLRLMKPKAICNDIAPGPGVSHKQVLEVVAFFDKYFKSSGPLQVNKSFVEVLASKPST